MGKGNLPRPPLLDGKKKKNPNSKYLRNNSHFGITSRLSLKKKKREG